MSQSSTFIQGEVKRTIDDRFRITLPAEMAAAVTDEDGNTIVTKERAGCLSLWKADDWQRRMESGIAVIRSKVEAGLLEPRRAELQRLGRLLSTRSRPVQLAGRSRFLVPEGFREFLNVPAGSDVMVIGAVVCVEIWSQQAWLETLHSDMPDFGDLFQGLVS